MQIQYKTFKYLTVIKHFNTEEPKGFLDIHIIELSLTNYVWEYII